MIAYAKIFSGSYSNKFEQGFFKSFTGQNAINECVKNKGVFFRIKQGIGKHFVSIISILLRVPGRVILLSSNKGQFRKK